MRFVENVPQPVEVTEENLEEVFLRCWNYDRMIGIDTETLGKGHLKTDDQIICMTLSPDTNSRFYVPRHLIRRFLPLLTRKDVTWAIFNSKFDAHRFSNMDVRLGGRWADGNVLDWLVDEDLRENRHGLKECSADYLGIPTHSFTHLFGKDDPLKVSVPGDAKYDLWVDYATLDAWLHRETCLVLLDLLKDRVKWHDRPDETLLHQYWYEEEPQLQTLWRMERRGLSTDAGMFREMGRRVEADMAVVATRINSKLGRPFNPNSNDHKAELLYGPSPRGLGLPIKKKTDGGAGSTDASVMEYFAGQGVEICQDLLAWSELQKLQGYVVGLPKHISKRTGRIHTTFSPTKVTGRLSSADPNLQNIPRKDNDKYGIRGLLIAPTDMGEDYVLIVSDYAQLEMRVLADISGDEVMIEGIRSGLDMHSYTAAKMNQMEYSDFTALVKSGKAREKLQAKLRDEGVHELDFPVEAQLTERETWAMGMRTAAKAIGFGIVYGITEHGLAVQLTDALGRPVTKEEALSMIEMYLDTFPGVRAYMETTKAVARRTGRVQTYRGRFRHLSKAKSSQKFEMFRAFRQAINARIQGSAHDIVKRAMLYCEFDLYLRDVLKAELVLQVHDELIWQCPRRTAEEAVEIIQHHMEHPFSNPLAVPLVAEPTVVTRWSDAK